MVTNTHIALAEENHQWPLPRLHDPPKVLSGPQFVLKKKQKIINITDVVRYDSGAGCTRRVDSAIQQIVIFQTF